MKWMLIKKNPNHNNKFRHYRLYKKILADEQDNHCVYCGLKDVRLGGIGIFHVEHYKPKSIFLDLEHNYLNLFYCCPICNRFKGNDWPNDPDEHLSVPCYPNPQETDYNTIFEWSSDFRLFGNNPASVYIIEKLYLNRPQLIKERRFFSSLNKLNWMINEARNLMEKLEKSDDNMVEAVARENIKLTRAVVDSTQELIEAFLRSSYTENDIKR